MKFSVSWHQRLHPNPRPLGLLVWNESILTYFPCMGSERSVAFAEIVKTALETETPTRLVAYWMEKGGPSPYETFSIPAKEEGQTPAVVARRMAAQESLQLSIPEETTDTPSRNSSQRLSTKADSTLEAYEMWRKEHNQGWGLAWLLAASIMERFYVSHGIRATVLKREYMGYYGILLQKTRCAKHRTHDHLGRLTMSGNVENWTTGGPGDHGLKLTERAFAGEGVSSMLAEAVAHLGLTPLPPTPHSGCHHNRRGASAVLIFRLAAVLALRHDHHVDVEHPDEISRDKVIPDATNPAGFTQIRANGRRIVLSNEGTVLIPTGRRSLWSRYMDGDSLGDLLTWAEQELGLYSQNGGSLLAGGYSEDEHQHRYAAWCAARASGRGLRGSTNKVVRSAIDASGLRKLLRATPDHWPATSEEFDTVHPEWCNEILRSLHRDGVNQATYGRAAKIVAIYLKTRVVCGGHASSSFGRVAHPPIDRVLLQALAKHDAHPRKIRALWRSTSWTELDQDAYFKLVRGLRAQGLDRGAFWRVEQWWIGD